MIRKQIFIVSVALVTMCSCEKSTWNMPAIVPVDTTSIVPASTPATILNLAPFKLALPINSSGLEQVGTACITKTNDQLLAGYTSSYFYVSADTGVTFWCPIDGATSSPGVGSDHPRTELIENYLWNMNSLTVTSRLDAVFSVAQYPTGSNDLIIGQIHGGGTIYSSAPFVMLHATAGNIIAYVKGVPSGNAGTQHATLLQNVANGAKVAYSIATDSSNIYFTASCPGATGSGSWSLPIPAAWAGITVRFSAGDYVQAAGSSSTDGGKITFYSLNITH